MFEAMRFIIGFIILIVLTSFLTNTMLGASTEVIIGCFVGIVSSIYVFYRVCIGSVIKL